VTPTLPYTSDPSQTCTRRRCVNVHVTVLLPTKGQAEHRAGCTRRPLQRPPRRAFNFSGILSRLRRERPHLGPHPLPPTSHPLRRKPPRLYFPPSGIVHPHPHPPPGRPHHMTRTSNTGRPTFRGWSRTLPSRRGNRSAPGSPLQSRPTVDRDTTRPSRAAGPTASAISSVSRGVLRRACLVRAVGGIGTWVPSAVVPPRRAALAPAHCARHSHHHTTTRGVGG